MSYCGGCGRSFGGTYIFPFEGVECGWSNGVRAVAYVAFLLYLFLGIAMASDAFMGAIEAITSSTRTVRARDGRARTVLVWNPTVANLSLMALGSSAPEILLSVVELLVGNMRAGELGPNTIVGSAAFNLLVITAICIMSMPAGQTRLIKDLQIFGLTSTVSVLAYVWLTLIVAFVRASPTPGRASQIEFARPTHSRFLRRGIAAATQRPQSLW
jgi:solute carrier family 8 (sodium/calcium exchanger)